MLQLAVTEDGPRVIAAARHHWSEEQRANLAPNASRAIAPAAIAAELNRLASQGQFRGREIVLSMPRELVQVKTVRLPSMPMDDLIQAAEIEAQALFGVDDRNAIVRAIPAGEVRHGNETRQEIIALCVRNGDVDTLVEAWHRTGFRPIGIDFEPAAIYRSVERFVRRRDDEAEVNVIVDVGSRRTMVVIGRGREMNFLKSFEIGGGMLTHAVARKLGIGIADAETLRLRLADTHDQARAIGTDPVRQAVIDAIRPICEEAAREVALCLRYYSVNFRGQRPSRVRIVGGESADPTVMQLLANALPVPVEAGKPILNADCSLMKAADRTDAMGEWTHAFGLALKPTKGNFADRSGTSRAARPPTSDRVTEVSASVNAISPELNADAGAGPTTAASTTPAEPTAPAPVKRVEVAPQTTPPPPVATPEVIYA